MASATVTNAMGFTGSAYEVADGMTKPYELPLAIGQRGGLLAQSLIYMTASGLAPQIRVHFYGQSASGVTAGVLHVVNVPYHLGYVDHTAWTSGGAGLVYSQVDNVNLVLENFGPQNARSVWATWEARQTAFGFGNSATMARHKIGILQD
jgi:hypothetical protein